MERKHYTTKGIISFEAVQVSMENMDDVGEWCEAQGWDENGVKVHRTSSFAALEDRALARIGDWVVTDGQTFQVYTPEEFDEVFTPMKSDPLF